MNAEIIALALKGLTVQRILGRRFAVFWMKSRGFTAEQTVDVLLKGRMPC
jgi:hypothetical protein